MLVSHHMYLPFAYRSVAAFHHYYSQIEMIIVLNKGGDVRVATAWLAGWLAADVGLRVCEEER